MEYKKLKYHNTSIYNDFHACLHNLGTTDTVAGILGNKVKYFIIYRNTTKYIDILSSV